MKYNKISQEAFESIQVEAGVVLSSFDIEAQEVTDANIICATSGGINVKATAQFTDLGADIDNCPEKTKELMHLDGWETSIGFTALNMTKESLIRALGCASEDGGKITLDAPGIVDAERFKDIWWVGDTVGGAVAVCLKNGLSNDGLSIQTGKKDKGKLTVTINGHYTIKDTSKVPLEIYLLSE